VSAQLGTAHRAGRHRIIVLMHFVIASGILGLGQSASSFGTTLALILTWFVVMGGVVNFLVGYIVSAVMVERKQNQERAREYDARHTPERRDLS
jgi:membrane protein YqaA with SNARE-associated domain